MAHAPRPFLVPPKTPLFRRRSVQVMLLVGLWGLFALVGWGLRTSQDTARYGADVEAFGNQVSSALSSSGVASVVQGGPLILPEMGNVIVAIRQGQRPGGLNEQVDIWATSTEEAATGIASIETDHPPLREAQEDMVRGLRLYGTVARHVGVARLVTGPTQQQLLNAIDEQLLIAAEVFDSGWRTLQAEALGVGLAPPAQQQPGGVPPGLPPGFEFPPGTELPSP